MQSNKLTILAQGSFTRGDVFCEGILVVEGGVEGNVVGNRVIIKSTGWVHGDIACGSLSIEQGGMVDGEVRVATQRAGLVPGKAQPAEELPSADDAHTLPAGASVPTTQGEGVTTRAHATDTEPPRAASNPQPSPDTPPTPADE